MFIEASYFCFPTAIIFQMLYFIKCQKKRKKEMWYWYYVSALADLYHIYLLYLALWSKEAMSLGMLIFWEPISISQYWSGSTINTN